MFYLTADLFNFFDATIVTNWMICCCHIYAILWALGSSLYYRQLVFGRWWSHHSPINDTEPTSATHWGCFGRSQVIRRLYGALSKGLSTGKLCFAVVCGRRGFFGVEGKYFEKMFLLREFVEIALQTYQA